MYKRQNHASIVDGIILSRAEFVRYPHRDMAALEKALQQTAASRKKIIITDTVFSMDGDTAPLPEIVSLAERFGAITMVDEAHATGVFGKGGRGLVNFCGLSDQVDVQMGTFSKAFGSLGGYICGKKKVIDYLVNRSRAFIYTTSLPPAILGACLEAVNVVESGDGLRSKLWENTRFMQKELTASGFDLMGSGSPIIPILVGDPEKAVEFSRLLLNEGIFLQAIRPPTVPAGQARLRLTVMATHARDELFGAVATIGKIGRKIGVINA